jgi:hypothetical protein
MTIHLPFRLVDDGFKLAELLQELPGVTSGQAFRLREAFSLSSREMVFARTLLRNKRNLWLFRCHQQGFSGDFVVIDMSDPVPARRVATVIELKARVPLKLGGSGLQARNAAVAVAELSERGLLAPSAGFTVVTGDKDEVLAHLGFIAP